MDEFVSNSHKFKERQQKAEQPEKKVEKVIKGNVKTRKKNELRKFTDNFISEDAANVKSYIFMDVLLPAIKKLISDVVTDGIDMVLYGETGRTKKRSSSGGQYVSYNSFSSRDRDRDRYSSHSSSRMDLDDIIFESRGDAEAVLRQMDELIDRYNVVTVADLYDMVDRSAPFTANKYGWTNVANAEVQRLRGGGYVIKFPKAMPID